MWTERQKIVLVACAGRKRCEPALARDLYTSPLFKATRRFAERIGELWFILSAKHGLVEPITRLEPYDITLSEQSRKEREAWADRVYQALVSAVLLRPGDRVMLLAGTQYRKKLEGLLISAGCVVAVPMRGMGIGQQLQWLNRQNRSTQFRIKEESV